MWKSEERKTEMTAPITLAPLDEQTLAELRHRYDDTSDAETRTRYQMLLLSAAGQTSTQIAQIVLRSQDTAVRVLKRFFAGGLDAVPRRTASGRVRTVTAAWEAELIRVIELDPHEVGQDTARPKRKLTMWETPAGRGALSWCHSTRTSTRQSFGGS